MKPVRIGSFSVGGGHPLAFILGPCVIESASHAVETALAIRDVATRCGVTVVFKADAASLLETDALPCDCAVFEGDLVEVFFVGSTYRHYVAVGQDMLLVDSPHRVGRPKVKVAVPCQELQIYAGAPTVRETDKVRPAM